MNHTPTKSPWESAVLADAYGTQAPTPAYGPDAWPLDPAVFAHHVHRHALADLHRAGLGDTQLASRMWREYGLAHGGNALTPHHLIASHNFLHAIRQHGGREGAAASKVLGHLYAFAKKLPASGKGPPVGSADRPFA